MAKIISLASSKVKSIQNGYEINDEAYAQALEADTDSIIGGISKGLILFLNTGERFEARYITGVQNFASLPVLFEIEPLVAPTLSAPADEDTDVAINATLSWGAVSGAVSYELELNGQVIPVDGTSYELDGEYETEYSWRVRAIGELIPGAWADAFTFTTESEA